MMVERKQERTQDLLRYAPIWQWLIGLVLAAAVAYFTTTAAIQNEVAALKAKQESQFSELLRRLDVMQVDIRELRRK